MFTAKQSIFLVKQAVFRKKFSVKRKQPQTSIGWNYWPNDSGGKMQILAQENTQILKKLSPSPEETWISSKLPQEKKKKANLAQMKIGNIANLVDLTLKKIANLIDLSRIKNSDFGWSVSKKTRIRSTYLGKEVQILLYKKNEENV